MGTGWRYEWKAGGGSRRRTTSPSVRNSYHVLYLLEFIVVRWVETLILWKVIGDWTIAGGPWNGSGKEKFGWWGGCGGARGKVV